MTYRVSQKNGNPHFWQISQLPRNLEIPSWTIFNSPCRVDFNNSHFFLLFREKFTEILGKQYGEVIPKSPPVLRQSKITVNYPLTVICNYI